MRACVALLFAACSGPGEPAVSVGSPTVVSPEAAPPAATVVPPEAAPPAATVVSPEAAPPAPAVVAKPRPPPGARIGPYDPDPDVMGDEVPQGGWEDAGVIYDAQGEVYGCISGGNDCMGPPR